MPGDETPPREGIRRAVEEGPVVDATGRAGDALAMRPLLLHGSRRTRAPRPRRVLHLEFAAEPLPPPLRWHVALR